MSLSNADTSGNGASGGGASGGGSSSGDDSGGDASGGDASGGDASGGDASNEDFSDSLGVFEPLFNSPSFGSINILEPPNIAPITNCLSSLLCNLPRLASSLYILFKILLTLLNFFFVILKPSNDTYLENNLSLNST